MGDEAETIESILVLKDEEIKSEIEVIVDFIKTVCQNVSKKAVIGISGGIDSAVVSALAVKALGNDNVIGIIMPYNENSDSVNIGINHCQKLGISYRYAPIKNQVDSLKEIFGYDSEKLTFGNDMARMRMIFLYHFARDLNALVIGTDNLTEHMLGYFTKYGDGGVDINPIEHLYKAQVYQLAKELDILQEIIDRPPSAELWDGQTDENEIGITYHDLDRILVAIDSGLTEHAFQIYKENAKKVIRMIRMSEHKRNLPYTV